MEVKIIVISLVVHVSLKLLTNDVGWFLHV